MLMRIVAFIIFFPIFLLAQTVPQQEEEPSPKEGSKVYVDSSQVIYKWWDFPVLGWRYSIGKPTEYSDEYSVDKSEIFNALEKDINIRNKPNKYYKKAKILDWVDRSISVISLVAAVTGIATRDKEIGPYLFGGGLSVFTLNICTFHFFVSGSALNDAVDEYNKHLAE
jgi:hypothetical protein